MVPPPCAWVDVTEAGTVGCTLVKVGLSTTATDSGRATDLCVGTKPIGLALALSPLDLVDDGSGSDREGGGETEAVEQSLESNEE